MDPWEPQLVAAVAKQLASYAGTPTPLHHFLWCYANFAGVSRWMREKPVAECMTALQECVATHKFMPDGVRGCLALDAPPHQAIAAAVTVASALFQHEIAVAAIRDMHADVRDTMGTMFKGPAPGEPANFPAPLLRAPNAPALFAPLSPAEIAAVREHASEPAMKP